MTDGLKDARSKMSRCLRRKACDPRTLFPGRVQVRETVRSREPELRVAKARIRVLEQDVKVAEAEGKAALARERAKPPREVVRTERVEVPVERVVEKRVEVPVKRRHTPAEVEQELHEVPPAAR